VISVDINYYLADTISSGMFSPYDLQYPEWSESIISFYQTKELTMPTPRVLLFSQQQRTLLEPHTLLNLSEIVARSSDLARNRRTNSAWAWKSEMPSWVIAKRFAHCDPRCGVPRKTTPVVAPKIYECD